MKLNLLLSAERCTGRIWMYWQDMDSSHFLDPTIETNYKSADYHRIFYGEILTVSGTDDYKKR